LKSKRIRKDGLKIHSVIVNDLMLVKYQAEMSEINNL